MKHYIYAFHLKAMECCILDIVFLPNEGPVDIRPLNGNVSIEAWPERTDARYGTYNMVSYSAFQKLYGKVDYP